MKTKMTNWLAGMALAGALLLAPAPAAEAQGRRTPHINRRQAHERHRIQQGIRSGELTPREAARLRAEQRHIRRDERRAKADGVVTPRERARLRREERRASRDIYRQKHDRQHRN